MKLLSIMILHKNPSLGQTRLLKGEYELGSFSFFTKRNAQEFMQFTAKLVSDRSATPSRSTIKEGEYFVHCFVRHDSLVGDEVEETKVVLHNTMQSVLERGEKLDDLIKASENLSDQSKLFYTQARKMNKCCNYV
uniref:Uncharacterized protein n=1 Tax=Meloidogyne javanica TaxID=6303 RepID=A0A915M8H7_MELJA